MKRESILTAVKVWAELEQGQVLSLDSSEDLRPAWCIALEDTPTVTAPMVEFKENGIKIFLSSLAYMLFHDHSNMVSLVG